MEPILLEIPHAWSDDELYDFCIANRDLVFERTSEGKIIIMSPAGGLSSYVCSEVLISLGIWNRRLDVSGRIFDSSIGFLLPNGAMRSPDVSWLSRARWDSLSRTQQEKFLPLCPDFLVEVRSPSDRLSVLQEKMQEWIANGCRLAWLIDPKEQKAYVYQADGTVTQYEDFHQTLSGEPILPGFEFELGQLSV